MHVSKTAMHSVWGVAPGGSAPPLGEDIFPLKDFQRAIEAKSPYVDYLHTIYLAEEIALAGGDESVRPAISLEGRDD